LQLLLLDLIDKLSKGIRNLENDNISIKTQRKRIWHDRIAKTYSWHDVASRTEKVYHECDKEVFSPLLLRLKRYYGMGTFSGKFWCLVVTLDFLMVKLLRYLERISTREM